MEHLMEYFYLFLPKLEALGFLGYWIVLLVSYLEALVFVGSIIPGATFIVLAGLFASLGYLDIKDLVWFAAIGTILGDCTSYSLGTKGTYFFKNKNKLLNVAHLEKGKIFFHKHGGKSLLLGKLVAPVKAVMPFVAGLSHMDKKRFFAWNIIGGFAWAIIYLYLGYFFGSAYATIELWISRAGIFFLALLFAAFLLNTLAKRRAEIAAIFFSAFPAAKEKVLPFSFSFLCLLALLAFAGITDSILRSGPIMFADISFEKLFHFFRDPKFAVFFLWTTSLAGMKISLTLTATTVLFLWGYGKRIYILPFLVILSGQSLFVFLTKQIVERIRPGRYDPIVLEHSFSFPSAHAAFAFAFFGFLAYIALRNLSSWQAKTNAFFASALIIFLIGLSRLYLGVHYLSDVIGGYLVGAIFLVLGITLAEWSLSRTPPPARTTVQSGGQPSPLKR
ncbi:phosphatase PAP2 family protein [bacterium]|nr:phosphatase PAP2 family protein [bacterium]